MPVGRTGPKDLEYVHFRTSTDLEPGASSNGWTDEYAIEGLEIVDLDDVLDRHEIAEIVHVEASLDVGAMDTISVSDATATVRVQSEISAQPSSAVIGPGNIDNAEYTLRTLNGTDASSDTGTLETDDTADLVVRPMQVYGSFRMDDNTNGGEASSTRMKDTVSGPLPGEWDFDRRDELYTNLVISPNNVTDPITTEVTGSIAFEIEEA